jgi:hypothetical protein
LRRIEIVKKPPFRWRGSAIRFGDIDEAPGLERVRLAVALLEKYSASGDATARAVELAVKKDLKNIPAEIIAEHVVKTTKPEELFQIARRLEHLSFSRVVTSFDALGIEDKAFIAMLLDYNGADRSRFASCWAAEAKRHRDIENTDDGPLFSDKRYGPDR